jgi:hypothetical protein
MLKKIQLLLILFSLFMFYTACSIEAQEDSSWQKDFGLSDRNLSPTGSNKYFVLEPGFQIILEGSSGFLGTTKEKLVITVLDETKVIQGIKTRIVEEREWKDNELYEVSRNYFAIDNNTNDVFYFGEEVDFYSDGKIINHSGEWFAGQNNAQAGLIMPGAPKVGMKYYQEVAPEVAMDRAEIVSTAETVNTQAGKFIDCLKTKEGTVLNFLETEYKVYAPGIGLIKDADLELKSYGNMNYEKNVND